MKNDTFYMVYVEGRYAPVFKHLTLLGAEDEAKRLTEKCQIKTYVLCTIKSFEVPDKFIVKDCRPDDDLPY